MSHPRWQRFVIAIAGPFMNIVLAVGLLTLVYMVHYEHPAYRRPARDVIGWCEDRLSRSARSALQPGDRIVRIDRS